MLVTDSLRRLWAALLLCNALGLLTSCGRTSARGANEPAEKIAGAVAGTVVDRASGRPLSFAEITATEWSTAKRTISRATSQGDGKFEIPSLPEGTYLVEIRHGGNSVTLHAVTVHVGETTKLDIGIDKQTDASRESYQYVDLVANPILTRPPPAPDREAHRSKTHGGIRGVVRDLDTKQLLEGAVVAATMPGLRDAQLAVAGQDGTYTMTGLAPGTYTLSVYYHLIDRGNIEVRRSGVKVSVGETTIINLDLDAKNNH